MVKHTLRCFLPLILPLMLLGATGCEDEVPDGQLTAAEVEALAAAEEAATTGELEPPAAEEPEVEAPPVVEGPPKRIFARRFVVPVRAAADRESQRIGYLRAGAVLQATTAGPVSMEGCREGWYELTTGGFVCSGRHVIAFEGRRLPERRSRQPSREDSLPYEYGVVRREAPMYRRPPTDEEAAEFEGYHIPGTEPPPSEGDGNEEGTSLETAGANLDMTPSEMVAAIAQGMDTEGMEAVEGEEEVEEEGPTLGSLAGDRDSVVMRTMMRGFYVSLDRPVRRGRRRYWRTQSNGFVPYRLVMKREGSEYVGFELNEEVTLPFAIVTGRRARAYSRTENGRFRTARGAKDFREGFPILEEVEDGRHTYVRGPEELWYRTSDLRIARTEPMHDDMLEGDKWFDVNLERQILVAYNGETPAYVTLISSGLPNRTNQPDRDYETLTGLHRVKSKHLTDTMDGDTAVDGPYSVDDVPYVMYYELAYALHSAFWHNRFGRPKSHGCVNLSPLDARWVFNFADPPLPEGWHSAYPTEQVPGTWIWLHGDTVGRR